MSSLLTQALQIAQAHRERSLQICRFASIAQQYALAGQIEQANELFSLTLEGVQALKSYEKPKVLLLDITIKLAAADQIVLALMVAQSIEESYLLEQALQFIAARLTQLEHIHQVLRISVNLEESYQREWVLQILGTRLAQLWQIDEALIVAQIPESEQDQASILEGMIDKFESSGQFDKAVVAANKFLRLAQAIEDTFEKSWKLSSISVTLATAGQFDRAFEVTKAINSPSVKAGTLSVLATKLKAQGISSQACELLTQALQIVRAIQDFYLREQELADIAVKFAEIEQYNQAFYVAQILQEKYSRLKTVGEIVLKAIAARQFTLVLAIPEFQSSQLLYEYTVLSKVLVELIKTGQAPQALSIAQTLENDSDIKLLEIVVLTLMKAGQYDQAVQFVQNLQNPSNKNQLLEILTRKAKYFCYISRGKVSQIHSLLTLLTSEHLSASDIQKSHAIAEAGVDNLFELLKLNLRYGFRERFDEEIDQEATVGKLMDVVGYIKKQGSVRDLRELCRQNDKLVLSDLFYAYTGKFWGLGFFGRNKDSDIYLRKLQPKSWIYKHEIECLGDEIPIVDYFLEENVVPISGYNSMIFINKEALRQFGGETRISKRFLIKPGRQENAFEETVDGDRSLVSDLCIISSQVDSYTLHLACSLKYFSDMGGVWDEETNEWLVGPHGRNMAFFEGKIDAEFDSIISVHGVCTKTKTIMGTPLFLLNSRTSDLWL